MTDYKWKSIIVEDNTGAVEVLEKYLSLNEDTHLVQSFSSPLSALTFLKKNGIDLIFLDVDMPEMHGMDFITLIENSLQYGAPYIILTTAHMHYALPALEQSRYVRGFLTKPFEYSKFLSAIKKFKATAVMQETIEPSPLTSNHLFIKVKNDICCPTVLRR